MLMWRTKTGLALRNELVTKKRAVAIDVLKVIGYSLVLSALSLLVGLSWDLYLCVIIPYGLTLRISHNEA